MAPAELACIVTAVKVLVIVTVIFKGQQLWVRATRMYARTEVSFGSWIACARFCPVIFAAVAYRTTRRSDSSILARHRVDGWLCPACGHRPTDVCTRMHTEYDCVCTSQHVFS